MGKVNEWFGKVADSFTNTNRRRGQGRKGTC